LTRRPRSPDRRKEESIFTGIEKAVVEREGEQHSDDAQISLPLMNN
jgi:hypothetical protein